VGDPPMNIVEGYFKRSGSSTVFFLGSKFLNLNSNQKNSLKKMNLELGKKYLLGLRPTELAVCSVGSKKKAFVGEVYTIETFGKYNIVTVTFDEEFLKIKVTDNLPIKIGQEVGIFISAAKLTLFERDTGSVLKH
jgi:ABC-type sugar transport system ATPase subunit